MRKLLLTLVLFGFTRFGLAQTGSNQESIASQSLSHETDLTDESEDHSIGLNHQGRCDDGPSGNSCQIIIPGSDVTYLNLMNIYKGRSLQLVRDIDSGQVFWSPSQSVLKKPFENTVFS